jgi:hypothetical protein
MNNPCQKDDAQKLLSKLVAELNVLKNQGINNDITEKLEEDIKILSDYRRKVNQDIN